jgi:23S rRNA U2552 (ribose-2'-O)-methylase RlmE/FtsJ
MLYFLLPKLNPNIYINIDVITAERPPAPFISNSLSFFLVDIKKQISVYEYKWNIYKSFVNPYEYIHCVVPNKKKCISKYRPISRSYFKMIELCNFFDIHSQFSQPINCFHLAEGPGGFIEAFVNLRNNDNDKYTGMTLIDNNNRGVPSWKKSESFLNKHPNVFIESGADSTGNILSLENFEGVVSKYGEKMDIITADGGFDFSVDFDNQEMNMTSLLFAQISYGICIQKKGGTFILKIFDIFLENTIDIIAILSSFYSIVYITKPFTSRYANSEKYIVCKGFLYASNAEFYPFFKSALCKIINLTPVDCSADNAPPTVFINRVLKINIPYLFLNKIEEINTIIGHQQIDCIHSTILLIENKNKDAKIKNLVKINIQKCIKWCIKNNIQYNTIM